MTIIMARIATAVSFDEDWCWIHLHESVLVLGRLKTMTFALMPVNFRSEADSISVNSPEKRHWVS